jgi:hypothetical protein
MDPLFCSHFAATWALVGLIWTIQLVHYPLFAQVGRENFIAYHRSHMQRVGWVVGPLMLVEICSGAWIVWSGCRDVWVLASLLPLALIWLSTWRVQIPLHLQLAEGFDPKAHQRLVATNWWRTAAWTLRGLALLISSG